MADSYSARTHSRRMPRIAPSWLASAPPRCRHRLLRGGASARSRSSPNGSSRGRTRAGSASSRRRPSARRAGSSSAATSSRRASAGCPPSPPPSSSRSTAPARPTPTAPRSRASPLYRHCAPARPPAVIRRRRAELRDALVGILGRRVGADAVRIFGRARAARQREAVRHLTLTDVDAGSMTRPDSSESTSASPRTPLRAHAVRAGPPDVRDAVGAAVVVDTDTGAASTRPRSRRRSAARRSPGTSTPASQCADDASPLVGARARRKSREATTRPCLRQRADATTRPSCERSALTFAVATQRLPETTRALAHCSPAVASSVRSWIEHEQPSNEVASGHAADADGVEEGGVRLHLDGIVGVHRQPVHHELHRARGEPSGAVISHCSPLLRCNRAAGLVLAAARVGRAASATATSMAASLLLAHIAYRARRGRFHGPASSTRHRRRRSREWAAAAAKMLVESRLGGRAPGARR